MDDFYCLTSLGWLGGGQEGGGTTAQKKRRGRRANPQSWTRKARFCEGGKTRVGLFHSFCVSWFCTKEKKCLNLGFTVECPMGFSARHNSVLNEVCVVTTPRAIRWSGCCRETLSSFLWTPHLRFPPKKVAADVWRQRQDKVFTSIFLFFFIPGKSQKRYLHQTSLLIFRHV